jgi:CheY-like chemotaxis protein
MSRSRTVLHIDDDPDTRLLVRELAQGLDLRWLGAGAVEEALRRYANEAIDLILLDHRLGPESGAQLLPRLKAAWRCPIWLLTGLPPEALAREVSLPEAAGVISKDQLLGGASELQRILTMAWTGAASGVVN